MLNPVLFIGCGGSGQKAVRFIRHAVERRLAMHDLGVPRGWQFLGFDTLHQQEDPLSIPVMPETDFESLNLRLSDYLQLEQSLMGRYGPSAPGSAAYPELIGWRPNAAQVNVPLREGAGRMRAVGRAAGIAAVKQVVAERIERAVTEIANSRPELKRVSERLGVPDQGGEGSLVPIVVVIGSMAGGTGAGIMLDVVDVVRGLNNPNVVTSAPNLVAFTADIFTSDESASLCANTTAFMAELMATYYNSEESNQSALFGGGWGAKRGPHSVFIIGRQNLEGVDLQSSTNVYRAVGDAMSEWVLDKTVQDQVSNFLGANAMDAASGGGYPFAKAYQPGLVRSFGSSRLAIGRDRFEEYVTKLLVRELAESLRGGWRNHVEAELGSAATQKTNQLQFEEMIDRHFKPFLQALGLDERGKQANQIQDVFVGPVLEEAEKSTIGRGLAQVLSGANQKATEWGRALRDQEPIARRASESRAIDLDEAAREWRNQLFKKLLRLSSLYSAVYGYDFAAALVRRAQREVTEVAIEVHNESKELTAASQGFLQSAQEQLRGAGNGKLQFESQVLQRVVGSLQSSLLGDWKRVRLEQVHHLMESVAEQMLDPLATQLEIGHDRVTRLFDGERVGDQEDQLQTFPTIRSQSVPESLSASSLEFFLESSDRWPRLLAETTADAVDEFAREELPAGFVKFSNSGPRAAVVLAALGGFYVKRSGEGSFRDEQVPPIVWAEGQARGDVVWSTGLDRPVLTSEAEIAMFERRALSWIHRPDSKMQRLVTQDLGEYLSPTTSSGSAVPEHDQRMRDFKQRLEEAWQRSKPLLSLDEILHDVIYNESLEVSPVVPKFPFGNGHPAQEVVRSVLGDHAQFTNSPSEAVTLSGFLASPVTPLVVNSFVRPLASVLQTVQMQSEETFQSEFWKWRRARVLPEFVPMNAQVRRAVIRGFVIARMFGTMTAETRGAATVSTPAGVRQFPFPLLTKVGAGTLLPALLEAFILCFGRYDRHRDAFDAYGELFRLGENLGSDPRPELEGSGIRHFIQTGTLPAGLEVLDPARAEAVSVSDALPPAEQSQARIRNLEDYLQRQIDYYIEVAQTPFTGREHRDKPGRVDPVTTLDRELVDDIKGAHELVLKFVKADW